MKLTKILYLSSVFCFFATVNIFAQQQVLEFDQNGIQDNTTLGPANSIVITFLNNIDNNVGDTNTGSVFNSYRPTTTATITLTNQQYSHTQNTGTGNPSTILGWEFFPIRPVSGYDTETDLINGLRQVGAADEIYRQLNDISTAIDNNFSTSETLIQDGISTTDNWAAFINTGFYGLNRQPFVDTNGDPIRYQMADMIIDFDEPVTNPILHFAALGGNWETSFTLDVGGDLTAIGEYRNSATSDFDLIASSASGPVSISKLSGSSNFEIVNDGTFSSVRNTTLNPDAEANAAHGSVLVNGEDVTQLTFRIYARGTNQPDGLGYSWSGRGTCVDPIDVSDPPCWIVPIYDGSTTSDPIVTYTAILDQSDNPLDYYIAEDAVLLSISKEVQPDEVLLTEGDSFRMLTSPVANTTYDGLIGQLWTQGGSEANGYDTSFGSTNIFTWTKGTAEGNGWQAIANLVTSEIPAGEGFLMTVFGDDNFDGTIEGFPKTLSVTGSEPAPPIVVNDGGGVTNGWILAGNPFKDPILVQELLSNRISSNLNQVVYIWDRGIGAVDDTNREPGWRYGILSGGTAPTADDTDGNPILGSLGQDVIMPFQGFFIERNSGTGDGIITFDNETTLTRSDLVDPDATGTFFRKDIGTENILALEINGENLYNDLWFRFNENGSFDRLRNDALELASYNEHYAYLSTKKGVGDLLTFSNLPIPNEETEIPVTIETTRAGSYTINASEANLSLPYDLYFVDLQNEESVRIDQNFSYTFTVNQAAKSNPVDFTLKGPQKAKTVATTDRFLITTQPKEFGSELPSEVALNQNYPNPFNPTTQISYQLPQQSDVRLQVYDMAGRQVATLVNESVSAGTHTVNFDASSLSSGVYLYKLQTGSAVLTRKLTLIK